MTEISKFADSGTLGGRGLESRLKGWRIGLFVLRPHMEPRDELADPEGSVHITGTRDGSRAGLIPQVWCWGGRGGCTSGDQLGKALGLLPTSTKAALFLKIFFVYWFLFRKKVLRLKGKEKLY